MPLQRLKIARPLIANYLRRNRTRVWRTKELQSVLQENYEAWNLPKSQSLSEFINYLKSSFKLKETRFRFPSRDEIRFHFKEIPELVLANSLKEKSYFTHYTAMQIHELTDQIPKTIFLNSEQSPKRQPRSELVQDRLDFAFSCTQRVSRNIAKLGKRQICLLSGKNTGGLGVEEHQLEADYSIYVTNIERTLIDIVVRSAYGGGSSEIVGAFRRAADTVSVNALLATLHKLDFVYPYHQAIGFYMELAGNYSKQRLGIVDRLPKQFDFYLTHGMRSKDFSRRWKIFFPKGLKL